MQTFDLHMHTTFSDGQYTPEEVVKFASDAGITTLAITDHDSVGGLARGKAAADKLGMEFINGIEISCQGNRKLHLLGLHINGNDPVLAEVCLEFARTREERARKIMAFLREKDIVISLDEVRETAHGSAIIARPHFAQILVKRGVVATMDEAFDKYLSADFNKIERPKPTAEAGIALIKGAGGIPVLAHPALLKLKPEAEETLIEQLVGFGLKGIECFYSQHSPEQAARYAAIAEKHGLIKTGGSDFHGEKIKPKVRLGGFFCPDSAAVICPVKKEMREMM
jgi:predicted metal-dependent phosphoesterase TrpH